MDPAVSLSFPCSVPPSILMFKSSALPYVTGAHIRENNLWQTWIRDAARFPMIHFWYENIQKYLDRRGLSDQCCQSFVGKHVSVKPVCREDPWITMRGGGRSGTKRNWSKSCDEMIMNTNKKKVANYPVVFFFVTNIFRSSCYTGALKRKKLQTEDMSRTSRNPVHIAGQAHLNWPGLCGKVVRRVHISPVFGEWWPAGCAICESVINAQRNKKV